MRRSRDLLRRRHYLMRRRASAYSHLQVLCAQHGIIDLQAKVVKDKVVRKGLTKLFDDEDIQMIMTADLDFIESLDPSSPNSNGASHSRVPRILRGSAETEQNRLQSSNIHDICLVLSEKTAKP